MVTDEEILVEPGSTAAPETFYIKITANGPYLVYGNPPIDQEIIISDKEGAAWVYRKGTSFNHSSNPVALCRCGYSHHKPFCDGAHAHGQWDPRETNTKRPLLEDAKKYEGPAFVLNDNEKYCAIARFCDACGDIWTLVEKAKTEEEQQLVRHEAGHCCSGRLVLWEKKTGRIFEPPFPPSIGIIEDPGMKVSGPIWVKGGIRIESADGKNYEIRNRVTLCRCGQSVNKPFCDGTHISTHFHDDLSLEEKKEEW